MPKVLNKYKDVISKEAIYVGRPTKWGNPFLIGRDGNRDEVCDKYEKNILPFLDTSELKGKDLVCFCSPLRCHADSLLKKANN